MNEGKIQLFGLLSVFFLVATIGCIVMVKNNQTVEESKLEYSGNLTYYYYNPETGEVTSNDSGIPIYKDNT